MTNTICGYCAQKTPQDELDSGGRYQGCCVTCQEEMKDQDL
jgi:hypothetical protein